MLTYTDEAALNRKLVVWQDFYCLGRSHGSHSGCAP
jgi:hypothetical protein